MELVCGLNARRKVRFLRALTLLEELALSETAVLKSEPRPKSSRLIKLKRGRSILRDEDSGVYAASKTENLTSKSRPSKKLPISLFSEQDLNNIGVLKVATDKLKVFVN